MFKLVTKPIRWVLRIIIFLLILITLPFVFMYKSVTPPETSNQQLDIDEYISEQIENLIDETNNDKRLNLTFDDDLVNSEIKNQLTKQYGNSSSEYVFEDENIKFQGAWVKFKKDIVELHIGAHINARILTYKTRVLVSFKFKAEEDGIITLKLHKFRVGNLTYKWLLKLAPKVAENFLGMNITEMIEDTIGGYGTFDQKKLELKVDLYNLVDQVEDNEELIILLLDLIYENELLDLGVLKDSNDDLYKFGVSLNLNNLHDDSPLYKLNEEDKFEDDEEFQEFLKNKAIAGVLSNNESIKLNTLDFNKVIDYIFNQGEQLASDILMESNLYENYNAYILNPYIEIKDDLILNVPVRLGTSENTFKTVIKVKVALNLVDDDLHISLNSLDIGDFNLDSDKIETLMEMFESDEFEGTEIVISNFLDPIKETGIDIKDISVKDNSINFEFDGLGVNDLLEDINNEINNNDLNDKIDEIKDKLSNNEEITDEDLDDLMEIFEDLDEEDMEKIQDLINDFLN